MKKAVFDFCTQVMVVFAYIIVVLNVACTLFGDSVRDASSLFLLGSEGIAASTVFEFLLVSVLVVGIRTVFVSNFMIYKMSYLFRNLCMLVLIFLVIIGCIVWFHWFPIGQKTAWVCFVICYILSFGLSLIVSTVKINIENKRLADALNKLKKETTGEDD